MLTAKEYEAFLFIRHYILRHQVSPTEREIAKALGIKSTGVVHRYIQSLIRAGMIVASEQKKRNLQINPTYCDEMQPYLPLPVLGQISAGRPLELLQNYQHLDIAELLTNEKHFVLQVTDHALLANKVAPGDYLICRCEQEPAINDVLVLLANDENLVLGKLIEKGDHSITLETEGKQNNPTTYQRTDVIIRGIYIGLIRASSQA